MYKIGEFSKLTAISISTLRYYEKKGILFPERVDKENNYCYYDNNSYFKVTLIKGFKEMGFTLPEIVQLLNNSDDEILYEVRRGLEDNLELLWYKAACKARDLMLTMVEKVGGFEEAEKKILLGHGRMEKWDKELWGEDVVTGKEYLQRGE